MADLPSKRSVEHLTARLQQFLADRALQDQALCIALSGGLDSVVLLHLLCSVLPRKQISALHVHHGLSPNADAWAAFCLNLCAGLGVSAEVAQVQVPPTTGTGLEAAARSARYACFAAHSARCFLLAQHADDQAETVLFNLLRGSGVTGAAGMPELRQWQGKQFLRPLLLVPRAVLHAYAVAHGLSWVEDESNQDLQFSRNFLRHQVLPVLKARFPAAVANLGLAAVNFSEADALLRQLAEQDWQVLGGGDQWPLVKLRQLDGQRIANVLRYRLHCLGWGVPERPRLVEFVRQVLEAGPDKHPRLELSGGVLEVRARCLNFGPHPPCAVVVD